MNAKPLGIYSNVESISEPLPTGLPYPQPKGLLPLGDCGGGNGNRRQVFPEEPHKLAGALGFSIRVARYPLGCSQCNPIEHRLFCHDPRGMRGVACGA